MNSDARSTLSPAERALVSLARIEPHERRALAWSFLCFFAVLCAYYIIRPLREEMGVTLGREGLQRLFIIVFLVMLAAVPLFGWVVSTFAKRHIVAVVYVFFIAQMGVFWMLLHNDRSPPWLAGMFFVWVSVFNLFVVSLFWSVMADTWRSEQAKRLYGFIAAGGSVGALAGPLLTQSLVHSVGLRNMLIISALVLSLALLCVSRLKAALAADTSGALGQANSSEEQPAGKGILAGATHVWRSPYLLRIAIWVLLANLLSTYFYMEQARIVGETYGVPADRIQLFARMDLAVSILTILAQVLLTNRVIERLGLGWTVAALPISAAIGLLLLAIAPVLGVLVLVVVIERAITFAFANPAMRTLYTVVAPEDKYKAQSFIDTVVFRGGDAASGWLFDGLSKGLGIAMPAVALLTLPLAVCWGWLSFDLGRRQVDLAARGDGSARMRDLRGLA